jgi:nucleotide-binding universal stress UspA family protein
MTAQDNSPHAERAATILVGIDGSPASIDALDWAARQAELTSSRLELVTTWDWPATYGWAVPLPSDFDPSEQAQRVLTEAVAGLRTTHPDVEVATRVEQGHPAPTLVDASARATLLVVGSRGHGEFAGMLIGSVSEYCATHAHCPVLVHRATT